MYAYHPEHRQVENLDELHGHELSGQKKKD